MLLFKFTWKFFKIYSHYTPSCCLSLSGAVPSSLGTEEIQYINLSLGKWIEQQQPDENCLALERAQLILIRKRTFFMHAYIAMHSHWPMGRVDQAIALAGSAGGPSGDAWRREERPCRVAERCAQPYHLRHLARFFYFLFSFFTKIYFRFENLQEYTRPPRCRAPGRPAAGRQGLLCKNFCSNNCVQVPGAGRPAAGRPAPPGRSAVGRPGSPTLI